MVSPTTLNIPVFAGQGTQAAKSAITRQQAHNDASSALGSLLLKTCYEAFTQEISFLNPSELAATKLDLADFPNPESLLTLPAERYDDNSVVSGTTLFLIQSLRYLAYVESTATATGSLTPFTDILKTNIDHQVGIAGFSSGILTACLVASSQTALSYLTNAVEIYRLAFWIGVRCQQYRVTALELSNVPLKWHSEPWSQVVIGLDRAAISDYISKYHEDYPEGESVTLTAVTDETCLTVSARPDILASFLKTLPDNVQIHKTAVDTLYHTSIHEKGAKVQVLEDIVRRQIRFPTIPDLKAPLRSSFDSKVVDVSYHMSLAELIVNMILTQPVNWLEVTASLASAVPKGAAVHLIHFGPGTGLARSMARMFAEQVVVTINASTSERVSTNDSGREPIAIIGMAVKMPGAPNVARLWEVLEKGINTISEIPSQRFDVSMYNNPKDPKAIRAMNAHTGNFIEDPSLFDNKFFRISPREAKSMDPQQRIVLQTAYEALEDSGYVPNATPTFQQDTFGCYIGVATDDYVQNLRNSIDVYYSPGTLRAFLSGRISYAMRLSGPSIVTDTACSSSSLSIYQACRALANGDCSAALAGGVNVISSPDMMIGLDRAHFLSPTGQCKPFDVTADGYSRSEGCGVFVLKRLSDAISENDKILGVIRGIEVNQSGNAHSITHPHAPTQMTLFEDLLKRTGVDRNLINVVEAHGTGTQAGDTNELESIRGTFAVKRSAENPLHVTTVKANIGHLEAASGAASLAKLLLMLRHRTIPRLISLKNLNPRIAPLESDNTVLDLQNTFWAPAQEGKPRMAMLNNFGAAGSNAAVLLEEFIPSTQRGAKPESIPFLFSLSAKSEMAINKLRDLYVAFLDDPRNKETNILDIAYTSTARRQLYDYRLAVSASTREELITKLKAASTQSVKTIDSNKAIFVFSGQGGQYLGMGKSLYSSTPMFKKHIDICHELLVNMGFPGVLSIITSDGDSSNLSKFAEFEAYQAAIFALEYSLAQLWLSWGLEPAAVVGHSVGEYAALVVAGVLSLKSALFIIASRVRLMVQKCASDTTGMMAVNLGPLDTVKALHSSSSFANLSISCFNSPVDCVVGGPLQELQAFKVHLDSVVRCKNIILAVPYGYHTDAMLPLSVDLTSVSETVKLQPPKIPIVSNVTGTIVYPGDSKFFSASYFTQHCCQPVKFTEGVEALMNDPSLAAISCWIEIGPHPSTLPMIKANTFVAAQNPLLAASIRKKQDPWTTLTTSLAAMYIAGMPLMWRNVYDHVTPICSELPSYPFEETSFWIDFQEAVVGPVASTPSQVDEIIDEFSLIGSWVQRPTTENRKVGLFETPLERLAPFITGHKVGEHPLCPASVYHELAFAGAQLMSKHQDIKCDDVVVTLRSIDYAKPLVYCENDTRIVCTRITHTNCDSGSFTVASRPPDSPDETVHCFGQFFYQSTAKTLKKFQHYHPILHREVVSVKSHPEAETISTRTVYELIFTSVVEYSKKYHSIKNITIHPNGHEAYAYVKIPHQLTPGKFVHHPVWMDTMLHVAGFVANMQGNSGDAFICSQVDSVKVIPGVMDLDKPFGIYVRNAWVPEEGVVIAEAYSFTLESPQTILAHFKRMQFRKVRLASLKRALGGPAARIANSAVSKRPTASTVSYPKTGSVSLQSGDVIRSKVLSIIAETCDISPSSLDLSADLVALGVDSLMSIEIFGKLQSSFSESNLDAYAMSAFNTPGQIIAHIAEKQPPGALLVESRLPDHSGSSSIDSDATQVASAVADDEVDIKGIMADVLGGQTQDMKDDAQLEDLGLDSLTSIEALHALSAELSLELPQNLFTLHTTIRGIQEFIDDLRQSKKKSSKPESVTPAEISRSVASLDSFLGSLPVPIQRPSRSQKPPLFLIHDGSGLVNYYQSISALGRDVWGIYNPKFSTGEAWKDLKSMASEYATLMRKTSSGPILIGGWSFGGVVAFEAARQLLAEGQEVRGVLLIDSPCPVNHVPLSESLIQSVVASGSKSSKSEISQLVKKQFQLNSHMLGLYDPLAKEGSYPKVAILRSSEGFKAEGVVVPVWLADRSNPRQVVAEWESLVTTTIKSWDIPGNHFEPFAAANINEVSRFMEQGCEYLDETS